MYLDKAIGGRHARPEEIPDKTSSQGINVDFRFVISLTASKQQSVII